MNAAGHGVESGTGGLAVRAPLALLLHLTFVTAVVCTGLDFYLSSTGRWPVNTVHGLVGLTGVLFSALLIGGNAERSLARLLAIVATAALPLLLFLLWLAGHVLYLPAARMPPSGELFLVLPVVHLVCIVLGLGIAAAPGVRAALRPAAILGWATLAASMTADAIEPGSFSRVTGRAAGFALDPNVGAFVLLIVVALALSYTRRRTLDLVLLAGSLILVFLTFSRGGLILWSLLALGYARAVGQGTASALRAWLPLALVVAIGALGIVYVASSTTVLESDTARGRLEQLLLKRDALADDDSRPALLLRYLELGAQRPFLGYGTGTALLDPAFVVNGQGPHNMFLRTWVDHGLWGLVTYTGFLATGLALAWRRREPVGLSVFTLATAQRFFSHTVVDERAFLVAAGIGLGLAALKPAPVDRAVSAPRPASGGLQPCAE